MTRVATALLFVGVLGSLTAASALAHPLGAARAAIRAAEPAPTVTEVKPNKGPEAGGTPVTITGTGFVGVTAVKFGEAAATGVKVESPTTITATSPVGAGKVHVTVTAEGGTSTGSAADEFTYVPPPTIEKVEPAKGPLGGKIVVTIKGANLAEATAVEFGSTAATIKTVGASSIVVTAPAGTAGTVDVKVTTPFGTSSPSEADHFTYVAAPTVSRIEPTKGPTSGGTVVTVTGTNLSEASTVKFGTQPGEIKTDSSTSITVEAPPQAAGSYPVKVTTAGGSGEAPESFTYVPQPVVSAIEPTKGPAAGGQEVTIKGEHLAEATAIAFAGTPAVIKEGSDTSTSVIAISPPGAGRVHVSVSTAGGTSASTETDLYAYIPSVTSVAPAAGPTSGGTPVTIGGTGFKQGAIKVMFGGAEAGNVEVESLTTLHAITPPGAAGLPVSVSVTVEGEASSPSGEYTYVLPPAVTAVSPTQGPQAGGTTVTITGANLGGVTAVHFGSAPATSFQVQSETSILATSPSGSGKVDVTVTTAGGTSATSAADAFTYVAPPPKEKESPPPPPAAATCTMKPIFLTIERKHKGKSRPKITAGQLRVTVKCTDAASVSLAGRLSMPVGKKRKHGKQHTRAFSLGPSSVSVAKGVGRVVALKLPLGTVVALAAKAKESVKITLTATSAGGSSHNAVSIKQLRI